ncbi:MAG: NUDIX domain-containing protein [Isosphaeraceae bacterium]|nr:NUDIX domain-containing protein [Isosphaeraceae bacterium]
MSNIIHERSAGVIPYRLDPERGPVYLVLHSATVRNPRAKWEFPKGGMEAGEIPRETAAREFQEETSLANWDFHDGFERNLSYTYIRRGRKVLKTVTYFLVRVHDETGLARSFEHVEDASGRWHQWGDFEEITRVLYHAKIRQVLVEAAEFLGFHPRPRPTPEAPAVIDSDDLGQTRLDVQAPVDPHRIESITTSSASGDDHSLFTPPTRGLDSQA